jgi:hypothetical protein
MACLETMLAGSERVYRWLVKIYPKKFRAEHESEMIQHFRDLCREQLADLRSTRMIGLWGHMFLDLAASAAIEHTRRRESMTALDRDLRWDVRYGVQMLFKHSLWLLKYTAMALTGGAVAIVLAAWIWSGVRMWQKEKPVSDAWQMLTGKTPEGYFQAALQQFPKSGMNETARQLEELTTRLGIFNPMPNRLYDGQRKNFVGPFDTLDAPTYVVSQSRKSTDDIEEAPAKLQDYLKNHRADLNALYSLVQRNETPRWETDIALLSRAPVPALFYHRQLHGLIALDILERTRKGETAAAQAALETSWKINQSLRERPEFLSQMVALSVLDLQTGVLRKMERVPDTWQKRIALAAWQESFWRAMELDAVAISREMTDTVTPVRSARWFDLLINSPLGRPLRRLAGVEMLEVSDEALSLIRNSSFCALSPQVAADRLEASHSNWSLGTQFAYTSYLRAWSRMMEAMTHLELTARVLEAKAARTSTTTSDWPKQLPEMKSSLLCAEAKWVHEIAPDGTIKLQCLNFPEWLNKVYPQSVPLEYSLKSKS